MRLLALLLLSVASLLAVDGTVQNGTSGKAQAGATVSLFNLTQNGPQMITSVKTAADGKFAFTVPAGSDTPGPKMVQAVYDGVVYSRMIPPGSPSSNLTVEVYQSTAKSPAKVATHMMLLEPSGGKLNVNESFLYRNDSKLTYNDPDHGTVRFYLPPETNGQVSLNVLSPNSVPVRKAADKTEQPNIYKLDFALKPGESRIDLNYQIPFTSPGKFETKVLYKDPNTKVLAPVGVTLTAAGLQNVGQEPQTKATIYNFDGPDLRIQVDGNGTLSRAGDAGQGDGGGDSGDGGAQISELMPQLYEKTSTVDGVGATLASVKWILLLIFGMLAAGFAYLYRRSPETPAAHESRH